LLVGRGELGFEDLLRSARFARRRLDDLQLRRSAGQLVRKRDAAQTGQHARIGIAPDDDFVEIVARAVIDQRIDRALTGQRRRLRAELVRQTQNLENRARSCSGRRCKSGVSTYTACHGASSCFASRLALRTVRSAPGRGPTQASTPSRVFHSSPIDSSMRYSAHLIVDAIAV
jgi:hypothetical protein